MYGRQYNKVGEETNKTIEIPCRAQKTFKSSVNQSRHICMHFKKWN